MKPLTRKEREVLTMLGEGQADLTVCRRLGLLPASLETILRRIHRLAEAPETPPDVALACERALRRRAENASRSLEGRFNALLEASPHAVLVISGMSGIIRQVNEKAAEMFGYSVDQLVGRSMEDLVPAKVRGIHPAYRIGFLGNVRKRQMGYHPPIFALRADGTEIEMAIALTASTADDEVMAVCTEFLRWHGNDVPTEREGTASGIDRAADLH